MLAKQRHGLRHLLEHTFTAASVGGFLEAFSRNCRHEVRYANHVLTERLVDKRGVRKAEERTIGMCLAQLDKVAFAHQGLAARIDEYVRSQGFALLDDRVDVVVAQVELMAVFRSPATRAMQVARARGIEQNRPRNVALVFVAILLLLAPHHEVRVDQKRFHQTISHLGVQMGNFHEQLIPVVLLIDCITECLALRREKVARGGLVDHLHRLWKPCFRVFKQVINHFAQCCMFHGIQSDHNIPLFSLRFSDVTLQYFFYMCGFMPICALL